MAALVDPRDERLAQGLAEGKTQADAYMDAGFNCKSRAGAAVSANRALKSARRGIAARVAEILADRERASAQSTAQAIEKTAMTKVWVLERLRENLDRAMQAEPVRDVSGEATGEFRYNGNVANKSLELIARLNGYVIDRKDVRLFRVEDMSEDDLDELARQLGGPDDEEDAGAGMRRPH